MYLIPSTTQMHMSFSLAHRQLFMSAKTGYANLLTGLDLDTEKKERKEERKKERKKGRK